MRKVFAGILERTRKVLAACRSRVPTRLQIGKQRTHAVGRKLANALANLDDVVFSCSSDGARLHYVSPSIRRLMDSEDPGDDEAALWKCVVEALGGVPTSAAGAADACKSADRTGELRTRSGRTKWLHVRTRAVSTDGESDLVGIITDVTVQMAERLHREQTNHRLTLSDRAMLASPTGVFIGEVLDTGIRLVHWNSAFAELVGVDVTTVPTLSCQHIPCADEESTVSLEHVAVKAMAGRKTAVVLRLESQPGNLRWCRLSVAPVPRTEENAAHCVGVLEDITDKLTAQHQVAEWAQRVDAVFTMCPDGYACFNGSGRLIALNPAMAELLGVGQFEAFGWHEERFVQLIRERAGGAMAQHAQLPGLGAGPRDRTSAASHPASAHTRLPVQIELAGPPRKVLRMQVLEYDGVVEGKVVYMNDVTREVDLDRLKSEFLSTAAHELRTPMASLLGYAELLRNREMPPKATNEVLGIIHKQTSRLAKLLDDLLDLARIEARGPQNFRFRDCSVQEIVHETLDAIAAGDDTREVDVSMPVEPLRVHADPEKMQQALLNVLTNAYKYSPADRRVRLEVSTSPARPQRRPAELVLSVADEGLGMTPEDAARAFDRFYRSERARQIDGTGLGLSLVKEIVEMHKGVVSLRSELGRGTEVILRLPLVQPQPAGDDEHPRSPVAAATH